MLRHALAAGLLLGLTACSTPADAPAPAVPSPSAGAGAGASTGTAGAPLPAARVTGTVATGIDVPWGVAFLPDRSALVAQRPTGEVLRVAADGSTSAAGRVAGVADQGEGGLLGLAFQPRKGRDGVLFAYLTSTAGDNRVVRMPYRDGRLGTATPVLTGIAAAFNHNGGLLALGPDGKLWIGTGDAAQPARAQDRASLNGKILRIGTDGGVPDDNPFPGSPVYSLGHRNVQGLAFDSGGRPWAVEFGQNTWDELNLIRPGGNYGWPEVEGRQARAGFTEPLVQWSTDEASPSGMAIVDDVAYVAGLRGERLWQVPLRTVDGRTTTGTPRALFEGDHGRLRNVVAAPGGGLWLTTSNRDGRGDPRAGDDRILAVTLG
jgi:glucose/arabinose dehydrogenase